MAWFLGQSIVFTVLAFLLGVLVGWIIWGRLSRGARAARPETAVEPVAVATDGAGPPDVSSSRAEEPASEPESRFAAAEKPTSDSDSAAVDDQPASSSSGDTPDGPLGAGTAAPVPPEHGVLPAESEDSLTRIEGIGPKISAALHDAGIRSFQQLADSDDAALRTALEAHNLRFAPSLVTWARQARFLADGDEDGFNDLSRRLVAGRDTGRA